MDIGFNGISQIDLNYAVECLEYCKQENIPVCGFNYPYFSPGGGYGQQWWQLDSALALCGYKWIDRKFAETALLNFIESQKEDGRICLWGRDELPKFVAGGDFPKQSTNVSSLPKIFDVSYHILQGSADDKLKRATYDMMKKYIEWWFNYRMDKETGLITAVFEETFIPYLGFSGEYAPVDTNTEVYVGCHYTWLMAQKYGEKSYADILNKRKIQLKESINRYLWNVEKGAYYPYDVKERRSIDCLMASTFYPLRLGIADKEQKNSLIALLKNHEYFNWDTIPLTSVSKTDKLFTTTTGAYQGNLSWSGNVWTLINETVIRGLVDCDENELASELALKTLYAFKSNCFEFINPFDGSGHGVEKYAWTASQFIELIVEVIFGVSYDAEKNVITISPNLSAELKNQSLCLKNIQISCDIIANITVDNGNITCNVSDDTVKIVCNN